MLGLNIQGVKINPYIKELKSAVVLIAAGVISAMSGLTILSVFLISIGTISFLAGPIAFRVFD
jgi:hypothetical protein